MTKYQAALAPAVELWSGIEARALREARRMSIREFAHHIGVSERMISKWEASGRQVNPRPVNQAALDTSLHRAEPEVQMRFASLRGRDYPDTKASAVLTGSALEYHPSMSETLSAVEGLGKADMERRTLLRNSLFAVGASITPSRDWLLATIDEVVAPRSGTKAAQVTAVRQVFGVFQQLDVRVGGGHARKQLIGYFTQIVSPLLRTMDVSTEDGQALFEAGAEQLYLIGWMAFDSGDNALAQRYLIQALRLAQESRSIELGAHILAALSDQATQTGYPDHGLQLAKAGRAGLKKSHTQRKACLADLWALQARAEAKLGDIKAAAHSILTSQQAAENIKPESEPEWAKFIPGAYLAGEYANAFADLGQSQEALLFAQSSAEQAIQQHRSRRAALAYAVLAKSALAMHDLEAASVAAQRGLELAMTVSSCRSRHAIKEVHESLLAHRQSPHVNSYLNVAEALLPAFTSHYEGPCENHL